MKHVRRLSTALPGLFWSALAIALFLPVHSEAAFLRDYGVSQFTLINVNSDGVFYTPDLGLSAVLTGGNNGSYLEGTSTVYIHSAGTGLVQFNYSYASLDSPPYDWAGYVLGADFYLLADTDGQSGTASFAVQRGQTFGFRVATADNTYEPGVLTVSSLVAPVDVPEPGTLTAAVGALAVIFYARRRRLAAHASRGKR